MNNKQQTNFKIELDNNKDNLEFIQYLNNNKSIDLKLVDKINNFYVTIKLNQLEVEVPFNYILINTNKKLQGIPYINFELFCSSHKLKYCNVPINCCYSLRDQKRLINNYYKIKLNVLFFEVVQNNIKLFKKVIEYLRNYKYIRFNCNNDLKNYNSIEFLKNIALELPNSIITGYTNRFDLIPNKQTLQELKLPNNLIINGSSYKLTNNYKTTTNLKKYINSQYKCLGSCLNCIKCFSLKNKTIYCLLHGSLTTIDKYYNTKDNRNYLIEFFNKELNLKLTNKILTTNKGLLSSLNKYLRQNNNQLQFKNYNELIELITTVKNIGSNGTNTSTCKILEG